MLLQQKGNHEYKHQEEKKHVLSYDLQVAKKPKAALCNIWIFFLGFSTGHEYIFLFFPQTLLTKNR